MSTRSNVWLLASRLSSQDAQCRVCSKIIKYCGTSTNIRRHLKAFHPRALEKIENSSAEEVRSSELFDRSKTKRRKVKKGIQRIQQYFVHTGIEPTDTPKTATEAAESESIEIEPPEQLVNVIVTPHNDWTYEMRVEKDGVQNQDLNRSQYTSSAQPSTSSATVMTSTINSYGCPSSKSTTYSKTKKSTVTTASIQNCSEKLQSYKRGGKMDTKITGALVYHVVKNSLPFSMVDTDGFRVFMEAACPHYRIPSPTTMKNVTDRKYDTVFELQKRTLSAVKYFSLTIDAWTETHYQLSMLGVTAHYIDDTRCLQSVVLGSTEMTERHLADVIADYIARILSKWSIGLDQVTAVTSDSGPNIVAAINQLIGSARHISCFAHTLDLILTSAFKEEKIDAIVKAVENIVTWLDTSCVAAYERKKVEDLYLLQSCPTRWNSTYYMLKRFLELKSTVSDILLAQSNASQMISEDDVAVIEDLLPILQLFDSMTKDCSMEKTMSVSRIIPITDFMSAKLNTFVSVTEIGKIFLSSIRKEFDRCFDDVESNYILSICTLLDPRYKKIHFKNDLKCSEAVSRLMALMKEPRNTSIGDVNMSGAEDQAQLSELDSYTAKKSQSVAVLNPCEITAYLQSPTADITTDPLQYWFINRHEYPELYEVVKRYSCVQGSSTPCERLFSIADLILSARRSHLTMERLEKLLFLRSLPYNQWAL